MFSQQLRVARIAAEHGLFNRIRQVAPICTHHNHIVSWAHAIDSTPNSISIGSAIFADLTCVTNTKTTLHRDMRKNSPHLALLAVLAMWANN